MHIFIFTHCLKNGKSSAQLAFLYLVRDYYNVIIQKYKETIFENQFINAFKKSVNNLKKYYSSRDTWYNPKYINDLVEIISSNPELENKQELKAFFNINKKDIFQNFSGDKFEGFIDQLSDYLINSKEGVQRLWNGSAGDILFLSFFSSYKSFNILETQKVQNKLIENFRNIKASGYKTSYSYWSGISGSVQIFEILSKSKIIEIEMGNVLFDYTDNLIYHLETNSNTISSEDISLLSNTLVNRIKHLNNCCSQRDLDTKGKIALINVVNRLIEQTQSSQLNYYEDQIFLTLQIFKKILSLNIYNEVISFAIKKILTRMEYTLKEHNSPTTAILLNNLFVYDSLCESLAIKPKVNLKNILIKWINKGVYKYQKIDLNYLFLVNMIIAKFHKTEDISLSNWIKKQLMHDIDFATAHNCDFKSLQFGVIGISGIGLTILSFLDPKLSSWNEIFLVSTN